MTLEQKIVINKIYEMLTNDRRLAAHLPAPHAPQALMKPKFSLWEPEENPFSVIYADLTHRCNMACSNCYIPNRKIPDMNAERLIQLLGRLPQKVTVRLIGAEATMREDLPEIIQQVNRLGHTPLLCTNGLKLADPAYVLALKQAGLRRVYISMNGADSDAYYLRIDNKKCASEKLRALQNSISLKLRVGIGAILVRGVNDDVPGRLFHLESLKGRRAWFNFRNVGKIGRFRLPNDGNFSLDEMTGLICGQLGLNREKLQIRRISSHQIQFPIDPSDPTGTSWIKITDWNPYSDGIPDPQSAKRGRVTPDFKIAPFFEHIKANEFEY